MKLALATSFAVAAIATIAPLASAAGYTAAWTVEGNKCDGAIILGEYTASKTQCAAAECKAIEGSTKFGTKSTCVDDHIAGAKSVLTEKPFVLVEVYADKSECAGDFGIAIAVTADGTCISSTNGKASYNVTMGADGGALWLQYATGDCSGAETKVPFTSAQVDGKACTAGFLKALAVKPAAMTMTTMPPAAGTPTKGYTAAWTVEGAQCDGAIVLGEYTAAKTECVAADCKAIAGVTSYSTKTTCVEDHIAGANAVLKDVPYALVEVYDDKSDCMGDFTIAIAVTANGKCISGTNGKASYNVTTAADGSALWLQYATGDCSGEVTSVPFTAAQLDGKTCTAGFLKALAVLPAAAATTPAPTSANADSTPTPAPTSAAVASVVSVAAFGVAAVVSASLL